MEYDIAEAAKSRGNAEFEAKRYSKAVTEYGRAIELRPLHAVYYSNRSAALFALGDYDASEKDAQTALDLDDTKPKYYYRKMKPLLAKSQLGEIDEVYRDFNNKCGASATSEERKAVDEVVREAAAKRKEQVISTNHGISRQQLPTNSMLAFTELMACEEAIRRCNSLETIAAAGRVLKYQPGHPTAHVYRAGAFADLGRLDEAIHEANSALKVYPDDFMAIRTRGLCYYEKGQFEVAMKDLNFCLSVEKDDPLSLVFRSQTYLCLGKAAAQEECECHDPLFYFERALEDNTVVRRLEPNDRNHIQLRATILRRLGRHAEASEVESLLTCTS